MNLAQEEPMTYIVVFILKEEHERGTQRYTLISSENSVFSDFVLFHTTFIVVFVFLLLLVDYRVRRDFALFVPCTYVPALYLRVM